MSQTTGTTTAIPVVPIGLPNDTTGAPTTRADQAVAVAKNLPDLIQRAERMDPDLAAKFTGKSVLGSKTIIYTPIVMLVSWAASKYGFGWPPDICTLTAGLLSYGLVFAFRTLSTSVPITGFFRSKTAAETVAALPTKQG